ncbi:MAG TPA: hypothetical protein VM386_06640, partial [Acidimicrobiales bacterium]|nr:hypothetical protein [Acidimicrobiales bacterium]
MQSVAVEAPSPPGDDPTTQPHPVVERRPAAARAASRPPRVVWLVVVLHLALLLGYSVLTPVFRAPDEYVHVDLMRHLAATSHTTRGGLEGARA